MLENYFYKLYNKRSITYASFDYFANLHLFNILTTDPTILAYKIPLKFLLIY